MLKISGSFILLIAFFSSAFAKNEGPSGKALMSYMPHLSGQLNMNFIENKGQIKDQHGKARNDIDFQIRSGGMSVFVGKGQIHYQFLTPSSGKTAISSYRMDVALLGANKKAKVLTEDGLPFSQNYIYDANNAVVRSYRRIIYQDIYPRIDWILYIKDQKLEYDFVIHAGGDASMIKMQYGGALSLKQTRDGGIVATTPMGEVMESTPRSYFADSKMPVKSKFRLKKNILQFDVEPGTGTVVIDPTLVWSTYYGGVMDEHGLSSSEGISTSNVAVDNQFNIYITGNTFSSGNIATAGAYQSTLSNNWNGFLAKFTPSGQLLWATYYGGPQTLYTGDEANSVSCDPSGNVFVGGWTQSVSGIATPGSHQDTYGGGAYGDCYLVKFDNSGNRVWGTYFGGEGDENGGYVTCDLNGNIYLTGNTTSATGIATPGSFNTDTPGPGSIKAFLARFTPSGSLSWGTYIGSAGNNYGNGPVGCYNHGCGATCDGAGSVYMTGYTNNDSFGIATTGGYQTTTVDGYHDAFLIKFDSLGNRKWGTYLGGSVSDYGYSVSSDEKGNVYMSGTAGSSDNISTPGSFQNIFGGGDGAMSMFGYPSGDIFLAKFDSTGQMKWSTYYGGAGDEAAGTVKCDKAGHVYLAGTTSSTNDIATAGSIQPVFGSGMIDAFLVAFDTAGNRQWGTYYGGSDLDVTMSVACDTLSNIYLYGVTASSSNISTPGSYQSSIGGGFDVFLTKISNCTVPAAPDTITGGLTVCTPDTLTYSVAPVNGATSYTWTLPSGWSGASNTASIDIIAPGGGGTISVTANVNCGASAPAMINIAANAKPNPVISLSGQVLSTTAFPSYQWYKDGVMIPGATSQSYTATEDGNYYVEVTNIQGCSNNSNIETVTGLAVGNILLKETGIVVYPDPNNGEFSLEIADPVLENRKLEMEVIDVSGSVVFRKTFINSAAARKNNIKLPDGIAGGVYHLKIKSQNSVYSRLFIVGK